MEDTKKQKEESRDRFMEQINKLEPHHKHLKVSTSLMNKKKASVYKIIVCQTQIVLNGEAFFV